MKPLRVHEELGYFDVDHFWSGCYYNDGIAGGFDFSNDTFDNRCYYNFDHFEKACYYNDGIAGGCDFNEDTFDDRCYYNVAIFEDGDFILSNDTFGSWFLVRVPESRCYFSVGTFENRCKESDPSKRGLMMTTFQPRQYLGEDLEDQEPPYNLSLQSRTHVILEEEEEKESPSFGSCRLLS